MSYDKFTQAYLECALWSSTNEQGEPLDDNYDIQDIEPDTLADMVEDCRQFQESNAKLLDTWYDECCETTERAGHDFWLTRNGHGAGFWERWLGDTPQGKIGKALTNEAHTWGEYNLYVGDDGKVYGA